MKQVFLFEVAYAPKGPPIQVRVHDQCQERATQRVQRMHRAAAVRFVQAESNQPFAGDVAWPPPGRTTLF